MANVTRSTLQSERDSLFPTNNANQITATDLRDWLTDGIDSFLTQKDINTLENVIYEAESVSISSGATTDLGGANGNFVHITGTTEITSFGNLPAGSRFILTFDNAAQIRASANLIIPGISSGNLKIAVAGDCCLIVSEGTSSWRIVGYFPAAGAGSGTVTDVTATVPLSSTGGTIPDISITQANGSTDGYLSSSDWTTFNNKGNGTVTSVSVNAPLSDSGTATDPNISIPLADSITDGYLSSSDWTNFNNKGDVSASGSPALGDYVQFSSANTIEPAYGTGIKKLLGTSDSTLNIQEISLGSNLTMSGTTLNASGGTGTVTSSGSSLTGSIAKFTSATDITKAVSGSDYAPATSGTSILKGSGSGGFSNASAGTDYLAPPSGTAILKANSGGALVNATAGTDYVAPGSATGSGLTMASSRLLGRTTASTGAIEEITLTTTGTSGPATLTAGNLNIPQYSGGSGSGTVNSGTANRLTYYAATGTAVSELPTAGSTGQILQSNGTGSAPSWVNAPAATLTLGSSIVSGATAGRLLLTTTSGANQVLNQDSNLNYDTTNDRLGVGVASPTARFHAASGVAANGQILLEPSVLGQAGLTGTTDGTMWYDTTSNNSSLYLRKLYAAATSILTKFITLDRNPDFATGSSSGIVISDANGTLSKSADLTALGIYAQTNTPTAITTGSGSLIGTVVGSTTLSTNFFGTGKTIKYYLSGLLSMANSGGPIVAVDFKITDGTTTVTLGTLSYDTTNLTNRIYIIDTSITCRSSGSNPVFGVAGQMIVNHTSKSQETVYITPSAVTATSLNTSSALTLQIVATWTNPGATSSISSIVNYCHYLN